MTRIDFRPWISVTLLVAVLVYVGCTTSTPVPPAGSPSQPKPGAVAAQAAASAGQAGGGSDSNASKPLAKLGNPAAVLIISGEQEGYLEPCGCSAEQFGGLIRRYDLIERLHNQKWPTAAIELGTLIKDPAGARGGFEQSKYKFDYALKALNLLNYDAIALSDQDLKVGVAEALGFFDNNFMSGKTKIVVANVQPAKEFEKLFRTSVIATAGPVKLGITAVIDPEVIAKLADTDKDSLLPAIRRPDEVLPGVLAKLEAKSDHQVLMVQGSPALALRLAEANPGFDIVVATSEYADPLKPEPDRVNGGKTFVVSVGKKGKYVGLVGFYPKEPEQMRFELVTLDKTFDGPGAPMKHLIQDEFRGFLKTAGVVEHFVRRNFVNGAPGAVFVGADTCKKCHPKTYDFWSETRHFHAFESLLGDPKPNTEFDAECISCHTTGFEYNSGWKSETETPQLMGNQCENCHGPGSKHAEDPDNREIRKLATITAEQADKNLLCYRCHDEDNSRSFEFAKYWKKIAHKGLDTYNDPKVRQGIPTKNAVPVPAPNAPK